MRWVKAFLRWEAAFSQWTVRLERKAWRELNRPDAPFRPFAMAAAGGLSLTIVASFLLHDWISYEEDLRRVRDEAIAQGLPLTWETCRRPVSPPARIACMDEALRLISSPVSGFKRKPNEKQSALPPWEGASEDIRERHRKISPGQVATLLAAIDGVGDGALIRHQLPLFSDGADGRSTTISRYLTERAFIADGEAQADELVRLAHFISSIDDRSMVGLVMKQTSLLHLQTGILRRSFAGSAIAPDLIEQLERLDRECFAALPDAIICEALFWNDLLKGQIPFELLAPMSYSMNWGEVALGYVSPQLLNLVLVRKSRAELLKYYCTWALFMRSQPAPDALTDVLTWDRRKCNTYDFEDYAAHHLLKLNCGPFSRQIILPWRTHLRTRIVIAVVTNGELPEDPFSPDHSPVIAKVRSGKIAGYYSVGIDGSDDGGDGEKDFCFPIHASFTDKDAP